MRKYLVWSGGTNISIEFPKNACISPAKRTNLGGLQKYLYKILNEKKHFRIVNPARYGNIGSRKNDILCLEY